MFLIFLAIKSTSPVSKCPSGDCSLPNIHQLRSYCHKLRAIRVQHRDWFKLASSVIGSVPGLSLVGVTMDFWRSWLFSLYSKIKTKLLNICQHESFFFCSLWCKSKQNQQQFAQLHWTGHRSSHVYPERSHCWLLMGVTLRLMFGLKHSQMIFMVNFWFKHFHCSFDEMMWKAMKCTVGYQGPTIQQHAGLLPRQTLRPQQLGFTLHFIHISMKLLYQGYEATFAPAVQSHCFIT